MPLPDKQLYTEEDYYNIPEDVRAELIDGKIYYQAAPSRIHQKLVGKLYSAIDQYITSKGGYCEVYPAPFAVQLNTDNKTIVEPDISVICDSEKLTDKGCSGAPDWIIEIVSPGSQSHDYVRKLNLYLDAGVREYWIVNPEDKTIAEYHFENPQFALKMYSFEDNVKVNIYDDLSIRLADLDIG